MTTSGGTGERAGFIRLAVIADIVGVLDLWTGAVLRPVRPLPKGSQVVPALRRYGRIGAMVAVAIVVSMVLVDNAAYRFATKLPAWIIDPFNAFTDFGRSVWFLLPLGVLYLVTVVLATAPVGRIGYALLAALAARFGFLFVAIGMPSLLVTILKRMIGRVRPSEFGPFVYHPFSWRSEYASLPSGHTTTVFAALVAIGLLVPRARAVLWIFAVMIGLSRVILTSHFPSDVIAGAAFGAFGAIMVRDWFAARRLVFFIGQDGVARPLPGPTLARIKRVARTLLDQYDQQR